MANSNFDAHRSVGTVSKRNWREEIFLSSIIADIQYNYNFYSDEKYIEEQKKC